MLVGIRLPNRQRCQLRPDTLKELERAGMERTLACAPPACRCTLTALVWRYCAQQLPTGLVVELDIATRRASQQIFCRAGRKPGKIGYPLCHRL